MLLPILLLNAVASVASFTAEAPVLAGTTTKSLPEFRQCFAALEQAHARPMATIPYEDGARLSNEGATGVTNPYRIRFTQGEQGNQVLASMARADGPDAKALVDGIKSCW